MKIFITADTHFGHTKILKYCDRPFHDIEEMDNTLVGNWNNVVAKKDTVYHLGDFSFSKTTFVTPDVLNGNIYLIKGNHDKKIPKGFKGIYEYLEISFNSKTIVLSHYPFEVWNKKHYGSLHFHGHCHGTARKMLNRLDVGTDCHDFCPISLELAFDQCTKHGE